MWNSPPQPLACGRGGANPNIFLFPSPTGEGLGVRALETST
ncbi:hypothetical protein [Pseudanabaena mucicola]|nr:hypothetical protein [Pseudanabaena mucicola]